MLGWVILAAEEPWAVYFGYGKALGGLFGLRRNLRWASLAAEKLGRVLSWLRKNRACAHLLEIQYTDSIFLIHRKPSEEHFCEARMP